MKTNQIMERTLPIEISGVYNEHTVRQRTEDGYFNATDLLKVYNKLTGSRKMIAEFVRLDNTQKFSEVIAQNEGRIVSKKYEETTHFNVTINPIKSTKGRNSATWMHPYMFLDFAMWLSPEFKYNVLKWVHDNLIKNRHESGDAFKDMCKALGQKFFERYGSKCPSEEFRNESRMLKQIAFPDKPKFDRNNASETELDLIVKMEKLNTQLINKGFLRDQRKRHLTQFVEFHHVTN